jgi:hypothetical protein
MTNPILTLDARSAAYNHSALHIQNNFTLNNNHTGSVQNGSDLLSLPASQTPSPLSPGASHNHIVSTVYFSVLGLIFMTPLLYYLRLHLENRQARRLREQSLAITHKINELRRARMLQLFARVKMVRI